MAIKKAKANNIRYFLLIVLSNDYILNDLWNDGYLVIRNRQYSETFIPDYKPGDRGQVRVLPPHFL